MAHPHNSLNCYWITIYHQSTQTTSISVLAALLQHEPKSCSLPIKSTTHSLMFSVHAEFMPTKMFVLIPRLAVCIQLCWEVTAVLLTEGVSVFTEASVTHEILISGNGRGIKNAIKVRTRDIHIFC